MTPGAVPFLAPGAFLNKLGRGPLDHAHTIYQGSRPNEDLFMFGQFKRTGGCYNELVVAFFSTGGGLKGKKIYTC